MLALYWYGKDGSDNTEYYQSLTQVVERMSVLNMHRLVRVMWYKSVE